MTVKKFEAEFAKYPLPDGTKTPRNAMMWFIAWQLAEEMMEESHRDMAHHILGGWKPLRLRDVKDWLDNFLEGESEAKLKQWVAKWMRSDERS